MVPPVKLSNGHEIVVRETSDFVGFGEEILRKSYHPVQREVLTEAFKEGFCGTFVSCNDGGKTREVFSTIILGSLFLFPKGRVMSTSGAFRQIKDQLNPELQKYRGTFPQWEFQDCRINTKNPNCFWHGFATNDAGKFEGQHAGGPDEPLALLFDEAKTIKDPVFLAGDRCRTTRRLFASSAGYAQGEFYASHTIRKSFFKTFKQTAEQCPHIPKERIAMLRAKWGTDHVLVKSALDAEFMSFVEGAIIQLQALDDNLANPPIWEPGERKLFCDFAWSQNAAGDENVGALREGNKITIPVAFRAKGMHAVAGRWVHEFQRLGLHAWEIEGDGDGEGANIIKTMAEMGWHIGKAHNGGPPRRFKHYHNLAAETWCEAGQAIIKQRFILPDDPEFYGQALNRKIVPSNKGLLAIESKQAMKDPNRDGGAVNQSPDRADAVFGAMTPLIMTQSRNVMGGDRTDIAPAKGSIWPERQETTVNTGEHLPGAFGGF